MTALAELPVPVRARVCVVVELDDVALPQVRVVICAAMALFSAADPVDVVLCLRGVDEPGAAEAAALQALCSEAVPDPTGLPETHLLGHAEALSLASVARVRATRDDAENARAVVLLTGIAQALWDDSPADPPPAMMDEAVRRTLAELSAQRDRSRALALVARRDVRAAVACATGARLPHVVVLFQHRSYWNAQATVCAALVADPSIEFSLVALDSPADGEGAATAPFLTAQGYAVRPQTWLREHLDDVDALVLDNAYDEFRPDWLHVAPLAEHGVRLVYVPYGNKLIDSSFRAGTGDSLLERLAWRTYLGTTYQRETLERDCAAGGEGVRVLGHPKLDRLVRPVPSARTASLRKAARGRPIVAWNPHFRMGPGGWSTFDTYLEPMVDHFMRRRDLVLLLRPHFRLFADLRRAGGQLAGVEATLRRLAGAHDNIVLDDSPDYVDSLNAADALVSDLSSLASEYVTTGKPVLYLHKADGPGAGAAGSHFSAMYRADAWPDVETFLDMVRRREDPSRGERMTVVTSHFGTIDGQAGHRIASDIVSGVLADLGGPPQPGRNPAPGP